MDGETFWRMIVKRTFFIRRSLMAACVTLIAAVAQAQTAAPTQKPYEPQSGQAGKDVVWVPTPQALVEKMLDMAKATPQDFVMDLGSGDGRTVISAAKRGIRAMGIEYNPDMVELSKKNAATAGVTDKATFVKADLFETDFSKASVITMFLLPSINMKLRPKILDLKPGTRVVSNSFTMEDWEPDQTEVVKDDCTSYCTALLWIVPAKVEGTWSLPQGVPGGDAAVPEAHRDARSNADLERPPAWRRDHLHRRQCEVHGKGERQFDEGDDHRRPRRLLDGNEENVGVIAIRSIQAKATRFVAGAHWIPGVVVDALGGAREGAPRPDSQIIGRDCRTDVERRWYPSLPEAPRSRSPAVPRRIRTTG